MSTLSPTGLSSFLTTLWETGQAEVDSEYRPTDDDAAGLEALLVEFDEQYRVTLPGNVPEFDSKAAQWAALMLFRACLCVVCRDIDVDEANAMLWSSKCPAAPSPSSHYSVDLLFRFLPDVVQQATNWGEDDPIVAALKAWCHEWPISSVGVADVSDVAIDSFASNHCLMTHYINRVIEKKDRGRVQHSMVQVRLRKIAGEYDELVSEWLTE